MTRLPSLALIVLLAACTPEATGTGANKRPTDAATAGATERSNPTPNASTTKKADGSWTEPTQKVTVPHNPAVPPVPVLVEVRTGDHAGDGYERITFAFRGPLPSYSFQIVRQVVRDGSGDPVTLPGTTKLSIVFTPARSEAGTGPRDVGYRRLRGYEQVGDYEGYVSYGLGVEGAAQVRYGESTRPDGTNVVALDIRV
ncbi:AMIN-like domain-containing (lipo)protein [Dactylosporangium sp. CA-152071]|uniref:AMIN-like domain-containing (lipo)protein n=1 Tax=Dactylosporangium sp. CA-152071 TaxID=3239933 RepID=UPI003D943F27